MSPRSALTPLGAVGRGLVAGAFGTLAMDTLHVRQVPARRRDAGLQGVGALSGPVGLGAGAGARAGRPAPRGRASSSARSHPSAQRLSTTSRTGSYGLLGSAQYGVVAGSLSRRRLGYGLPFGATVWAAGYAVLPAAGLYEPIWRVRPQDLGRRSQRPPRLRDRHGHGVPAAVGARPAPQHDRRRFHGGDPEGVRRPPGVRAAGRFAQRVHGRAAPRRRPSPGSTSATRSRRRSRPPARRR